LAIAVIFLSFLVLTACEQAKVIAPVTDISPTPIQTFPATIEPLSPHWIPYNPDQNFDGCDVFSPTIPVEDISNEQIIQRLFEAYMDHYTSPELGGGCRLESYQIEKVQLDDRIAFLANEQNVDFVGTILFSVQLKEVPSNWVAGNGALASDGWIIHKFLIVGVSRVNDMYGLKLIGTGP
jgi:hypothetical protein